MNIYQSQFLNISKEGETLIQSWTDKNLSVEDIKSELSQFMDLFYKVKPKGLVLDIKKCNLILPQEMDGWMAEQVLIPLNRKGIKKLAFTIADDTAVHFSIATSFDKAKPIIESSYFSGLCEATHYLEYAKNTNTDLDPLTFELNRDVDSFNINLGINANALPKFLTSMRQIEKDNQFVQDHLDSYYSLTIREMEIFKLIARGKTNKQIAECLFIEESSVKSHRKNIKQKLSITSIFDIYQYARCFQVI